MNIIDCAIAREERAHKHFATLGQELAGDERHTLFTLLGAAEEEHLAHLRALHGSIPSPLAEVDSCTFTPLPSPPRPHDASDCYREVMCAGEAYRDDYQQRATMAADEATRRLYTSLACAEEGHLATLDAIYTFVEAPKNFLVWGEFANLRDL